MLLVKNANYNGNVVDILSLDGKITKIEENIENYYGIDEIDLKGKRIFPSLIDGHVHVTGGGFIDEISSAYKIFTHSHSF